VLDRRERDIPANIAIVSSMSKLLSHKLSLMYESVNPDCSSGPIISRMFSRPASICAGRAAQPTSDLSKSGYQKKIQKIHIPNCSGVMSSPPSERAPSSRTSAERRRLAQRRGTTREGHSPSGSRFLTNLCLDMMRTKRFTMVLRMVINGIL
jgi:hypothetical protein